MPEIPKFLRKKGFRFIKVKPHSKIPAEKDWNTKNNYEWNSNEIQDWIHSGGNYGILPRNGLVVLDADEFDRLKELYIVDDESEKKTFSVKTGSGGRHYYFILDDTEGLPNKIIMFDKEKNDENGRPLHLGEIFIRGNIFVIGPSCTHPNGNKYEQISDIEPVKVSKKWLLEGILTRVAWNDPNSKIEEEPQELPERPKKKRREYSKSLTDALGINIQDVVLPKNYKVVGNEIVGEHPVHGSKTGHNFSINPVKNYFRCWRCNSGGDPIIWIAVEEGIIDCSEAKAGCLDDRETFIKVIEALKRRGYKVPERVFDRNTTIRDVPILEFDSRLKREQLPTIDEFNSILDESDYTLIRGPPRKGKTYVTMMLASQSDFTINYVTNRHSINGQAKKEWESIKATHGTSKRLVWLAGKKAMCPFATKRCNECELYPSKDGISVKTYMKKAYEMLERLRILDRETVWKETKAFCPYYIIKYAEKEADVCLTVPFFLCAEEKENRVEYRDIVILDEDSTTDYFYPSSVELATYNSRSRSYSFDFENYGSFVDGLEEIEDHILYKEEVDGSVKNKKRVLKKEDKIILECIKKFREINEVFSKFNAKEKDFVFLKESIEKIDTTIKLNGEEPDFNTKKRALRKIELFEKVATKEENICSRIKNGSSVQYFEAILFPFKEKPLFWFGNVKKTCRLVGDRSKMIRTFDAVKLIAIGFTRAEQFIKDYSRENPGKTAIYEITKFDYGKNYVVFSIEGEDGKPNTQDRLMYKALKAFTRANRGEEKVPSLVLCQSIARQRTLFTILSKESPAHMVVTENQLELERLRLSGCICLFYANSSTSRGVDAPNFDILFVESSSYANPYYDAIIELAKERDDKETLEKMYSLRSAMESDEITNSILRPTPVKGNGEEQSKFIFIKSKDLNKIESVVAQDMLFVPIKTEEEVVYAINIARMCARKVKIDTNQIIPGENYEVARQEAKSPTTSVLGMDEAEKEYRKYGIESASKKILMWLKKKRTLTSREAIISRLKEHNNFKDEESIREALRQLYSNRKISQAIRNGRSYYKYLQD